MVTLGLLANPDLLSDRPPDPPKDQTKDQPRESEAGNTQNAGVNAAIALIEKTLLDGDLSVQNRAVIRKQMEDPQVQRQFAAASVDGLRQVAGFVLASPDFQMR